MTAGGLELAGPGYRLVLDAGGAWAELSGPGGPPLLRLSLLASVDQAGARDETLQIGTPEVSRRDEQTAGWPVVTIRRRSTCWDEAALRLECRPDGVEVRAEVRGRGRLGEVHLLGGRSLLPGASGFLRTGCALPALFCPNPEDPHQLLRPASAPAVIGVAGDNLPGRGHWFFSPAPLYLALSRQPLDAAPDAPAVGGWLGLSLLGAVSELDFTELAYEPADRGFRLRLDYEGHRAVDGSFRTPAILLTPGQRTPYAGLRAYRTALAERGLAAPPASRERPAWWSRPMFCGWGAQCHRAQQDGVTPQETCTRASYDAFLAELVGQGLVPPTVVIDDGWQRQYGRPEPDPVRWPALAEWIGRRHQAGQRVLLWWKAWDPEGVPAQWCVRNAAGEPVALDPGHPGAARLLAESVTAMLSAQGLDADGLKIDFTARTPSGQGLTTASGRWGIALLHELLAQVYAAAKAAKPDALVITHTPHPGFAGVTDMIRLNDMLRLDDEDPVAPVVRQMRYRADVVRAVCPELLIDTDDWCIPDLAQWRDYLAVKDDIGVPALYYSTHIDLTGEALESRDYAALRELWAGRGPTHAQPG
jgi:hypothetical protein